MASILCQNVAGPSLNLMKANPLKTIWQANWATSSTANMNQWRRCPHLHMKDDPLVDRPTTLDQQRPITGPTQPSTAYTASTLAHSQTPTLWVWSTYQWPASFSNPISLPGSLHSQNWPVPFIQNDWTFTLTQAFFTQTVLPCGNINFWSYQVITPIYVYQIPMKPIDHQRIGSISLMHRLQNTV